MGAIPSSGAFELLRFNSFALSPREQQLALRAAQGESNKEIGVAFGLTEETIKIYMSRLYAKTGLRRYDLPRLLVRDHMRRKAIELSEWLNQYGEQLDHEAGLALRSILDTIVAEIVDLPAPNTPRPSVNPSFL